MCSLGPVLSPSFLDYKRSGGRGSWSSESQQDEDRLTPCLPVHPRLALALFTPGSGPRLTLVLLQLVQQARARLILLASAQTRPLCKAITVLLYDSSPLPLLCGLSIRGRTVFLRRHLVPWHHASRLGGFSQNNLPGPPPTSLVLPYRGVTGDGTEVPRPLGSALPSSLSSGPVEEPGVQVCWQPGS